MKLSKPWEDIDLHITSISNQYGYLYESNKVGPGVVRVTHGSETAGGGWEGGIGEEGVYVCTPSEY